MIKLQIQPILRCILRVWIRRRLDSDSNMDNLKLKSQSLWIRNTKEMDESFQKSQGEILTRMLFIIRGASYRGKHRVLETIIWGTTHFKSKKSWTSRRLCYRINSIHQSTANLIYWVVLTQSPNRMGKCLRPQKGTEVTTFHFKLPLWERLCKTFHQRRHSMEWNITKEAWEGKVILKHQSQWSLMISRSSQRSLGL